MCSTSYPLSDAAIAVAQAQFEFEQLVCDYDLSQRRYALAMLQARGDTWATRVLLERCPELEEKADRPPMGIAAD